MASLMCIIVTSLIICATLREGCGLPLSGQDRAQAPHPRQIRTKRCSCNSWDDKECIYFCHLDIIWVNTPSKVLPYGLGNPVSRRRRSAGRCECENSADKTCYSFCHTRSILAGSTSPSSTNGNRLLASLRSVVASNNEIAKQNLSANKKFLPINQFKDQTQR